MNLKLSVCFFAIVLFAACNKKEPAAVKKAPEPVKQKRVIVTEKPVRAGETDFMLPVGTTLTFAEDGYSIEVKLPDTYSFVDAGTGVTTNSVQPVPIATYYCKCSSAGSSCQVMYADGGGFGCLHSSCSGTCTGDFIYKGYSMNRIVALPDGPKHDFFASPVVQEKIAAQFALCVNPSVAAKGGDMVYVKQSLYGVSYYFLVNSASLRYDVILEVVPYGKASCDCEGGSKTSCTLKTIGYAMDKGGVITNKIYYCDGPCGDGCQLTV